MEHISSVLAASQASMMELAPSSTTMNKCRHCGNEFEPHRTEYLRISIMNFCNSNDCINKAKELIVSKMLYSLMTRADIPPKYFDLIVDCKKYAGKRGVYIHGPAGTGKTVFACNIGRLEILAESGVQFISAPRLVMQLQDTYRKDGDESAYDLLQRLSRVPVLILDDLGAEKTSDFVRQSFYFLINEREQWERKTVITSNYSLAQLDAHIDGRVSSRIAGMCDVVELKGKDRRVNK